jgi:hypothetical protein
MGTGNTKEGEKKKMFSGPHTHSVLRVVRSIAHNWADQSSSHSRTYGNKVLNWKKKLKKN